MSPTDGTQLDRIEKNVAQCLDRLTRMEERQNHHGDQLGGHRVQLDDHSRRLRELENDAAVAKKMAEEANKKFSGRWAAAGSLALVVIGAVGAAVGTAIASVLMP